MSAADVDVGYIAGHLGLDQPVITSLTTEPTAELVATLLKAVAVKAEEFNTLYADKLQTDIELENAVRSSESRSQAAKATSDKALKDVEEARQKAKEEGKSHMIPALGRNLRLCGPLEFNQVFVSF
jgi:nucleoprotein TPR